MKRSDARNVLLRPTLSYVMALLLAFSPTACLVRPAMANEAQDYAVERDEANARADEAEKEQQEANARVADAERARDEAQAQADEAADEREKANSKADSLQAAMDAAATRLDELYRTLEQSQAELSRATYELEATQAEIEELVSKVAQSEDELEEQKKVLCEQVNAVYRAGKVSLLDVLLDSSSFDEIVSRVVYANRVSEMHMDSIKSVNELHDTLEDEQEELARKEAEQVALVDQQQVKMQALEQAEQAQKAYMDSLSSEVVSALDAAREADAQESRLLAEVAQAENDISSALADASESERKAAAEREKARQAERDRIAAERAAEQEEQQQQQQSTPAPVISIVPPVTPFVPSVATGDQRTDAVAAALSQVGIPYGWGCEEPGVAFDCNSLTHWAWQQAGVEIPYPSGHYSYGQFQWMQTSGHWVTDVAALLPGDLVFYSYDGGFTTYHVAMYIGGGMVVHANGYRYGVMVSDIYFDDGFCGGGSPI